MEELTRLYVSIKCGSCNQVVGADIGSYFGKRLGDKGKTIPECWMCKAKRLFKEADTYGISEEDLKKMKTLDELESAIDRIKGNS